MGHGTRHSVGMAAGESPAAGRAVAPHAEALEIAVLIPCHNEEASIATVVTDFRVALPNATIYVYDNDSTDATAEIADAAGAIVRRELRKGKGHVVQRMFADVQADIYVLVDGDDTYDAFAAPILVKRLLAGDFDMIIGARNHVSDAAYRRGHQVGNHVLTSITGSLFGADLDDMLSGYRVMSRRFVKSFPALTSGFEIETELTVHALEIGAAIDQMPIRYKERPPGSASKLNTLRDGVRIARFILKLARDERPLQFFGALAMICLAASLALAVPVLATYAQTGLVPRLPTWVLAVALAMLGFLSGACGLILDTVTKGRRETLRSVYLSYPSLSSRR
jgi:hypothetical protein